MIRDRFYQDIVERLGGRLDLELYKRCALFPLRKIFPDRLRGFRSKLDADFTIISTAWKGKYSVKEICSILRGGRSALYSYLGEADSGGDLG